MTVVEFPVDVLYNSAIEWHESFSIQLGPEEPIGSRFGGNTLATVTILDNQVSGSLVLPSPPIVSWNFTLKIFMPTYHFMLNHAYN